MRLRWTVVVVPADGDAAHGPTRRDVVVDCPPGTPLAQVLAVLPTSATERAATPVDGPPALAVSVDGIRCPVQAPVGRSPLLDGAVLTVRTPGTATRGDAEADPPVTARGGDRASHLLELVVLAGPDAGRSHPLRTGRLTCGRAPGSDITIRDPRLSRTHCELELGVDGVTVVDLGSTNGTGLLPDRTGGGSSSRATRFADGAANGTTAGTTADQVPAARLPRLLRLGEQLSIGASLVSLRQVPAPPRHAPPDTGVGTRLVHRSPRARPPEHAPELHLPTEPRQARGATFPVLTVVLPALAATGLAVLTGSMAYLVLAGLGPVLVVGGWFSTRREARRDGRLSRREHAMLTAGLREQALAAADRLAAARAACLPGPEALLQQCLHPSGRLWERDPDDEDALRVRVGRAVVGSAHPSRRGAVRDGTSGCGPAALVPQVSLVAPDGGTTLVPTASDLVSVDLREGALGIVEPGQDASWARFVVGQLVALLPPTATAVVAVLGAGARSRWRWLHLLPHSIDEAAGPATVQPAGATAAARALAELVERRSRAASDADDRRSPPGRSVLVVLDDPDGEVDPAELSWLPGAHRVGVHVVAVAPAPALVPRGCAVLVAPASEDGVELVVTRLVDGSSAVATADRVGPWWAERLSRALAPLRPSSAEASDALPDEVHLDDVLDTRPEQVLQRWAVHEAGLPVPLGVGRAGVVTVDLTRAGPHALVAGTTGSGKSELLRTWLLGLAASRPPTDVAFLLVDYKGGATFDDLAALPHTVGLLTDLDGDATSRVLHSLRAEVHRRERLLASAGARDLDGYRRSPAAGPDLPRLLVVVDEFRILAEDAPDVLGEFVRLAATGRSLGMHLVLATQRPGGVVSADIRSNAALRIALRVQDAAESRDVVDRPDAARLPAGRPGRAVVVGSGIDETVQTAYAGSGGAAGVRLRVLPDSDGAHVAPLTPGLPDGPAAAGREVVGPTGTPAVLIAVLRAAELAGASRAASPWLPALPAVLPRPAGGGPRQPAGTLLLGTTDLPWAQARGPLLWNPVEDGPALVLGGPRSGRSCTLAAIARAAGAQGTPVLALSGEPGEAGTDGDPDHVVDTLQALVDLPPHGTAAEPGAGTQEDGRADPVWGSSAPALRVLLLLDDTDPLLDPAGEPTAVDLLGRLLRTGHRCGVGVALAGGRTLAGSRLAAGAKVRLVHRTTDSTDAVVAGVPAAARELPAVPGRCAVVGLPGQDPPPGAWLQAQVYAPAPRAEQAPSRTAPGRLPRPLPAVVPATALPAPDGHRLPLGLAGPHATPWCLQLGGRDLFAVAGPPRSGRTTTLLRLADAGTRAGSTVAWGPGAAAVAPAGTAATAADLLLVDDVDRLGTAELAAVEDWLTGGGGPLAARLASDATVVVAGATDWFADGFRGLQALARRHGHGVVLAPGRTDARDVLGARTGLQQRTRTPGRGLLVHRGRAVRIQLAIPDTRAAPDEPSGHRSTQQPPGSTTVCGEHDRRHL